MKRRTFIAGLGSAATWPVVARAQQAAVPIIGLVSLGSAAGNTITNTGTDTRPGCLD
jgi:hypothetical protein